MHTISFAVFFAGSPYVTVDGNRAMKFDVSMVAEAKKAQILMQLVIKVPSLEYFQCVRYLYLYTNCSNSSQALQQIALHTLLESEMDSTWLEVTIQCDNCNWKELETVHFVLQLEDANHLPVAFTSETAADLKPFLILYTYSSLLPFDFGRTESFIKKRQAEQNETLETPSLVNRTTVDEVRESNVTCMKHEVFLTTEELRLRGKVLAPFPGVLRITYCLGECNGDLELPLHNETLYDSRTRLIMHDVNSIREKVHPPPCCIPDGITIFESIVEMDDEVLDLLTFPQVVGCKCQL